MENGIRGAMVHALAQAGLAEDGASRLLLLQEIGRYLRYPLVVPDQHAGRDHLIELVNACARQEDGMRALVHAVAMLRPGSLAYERIRRLVEQPQVMDLLTGPELDRLRDLLADLAVPQLPTLLRRAAGPAAVPLWPGMSAWDAFRYLTDLNAGPDGFPPALLFVELVAGQTGAELAGRLTEWNDNQARRLGLAVALRACRAKVARVPADARLHLLIALQHDGIDPNLCLLSWWRQDDPEQWPPARSEPVLVRVSELERRVDELVVDAERAWAGHTGTVALEFVLPRAMLNLPVHRWHKEHDCGQPRPLCLEYPIVVRSLDRMRARHWHRVWHERWRALAHEPSPEQVHLGRQEDTGQRFRIDAILSARKWVLMVLAAAPPAGEPDSGADELTAALRAGLPAMIWHATASPAELHEIVTKMIAEGFLDLPDRVRAIRQESFLSAATAAVGRDLVLLWDDPSRLVDFDQPSDPLPK